MRLIRGVRVRVRIRLRTPPASLSASFQTCKNSIGVVTLNSFGVAFSNTSSFPDVLFFFFADVLAIFFFFNVIKNKVKTLVFPNDNNRFYSMATILTLRRIIAGNPTLAEDAKLEKVILVLSRFTETTQMITRRLLIFYWKIWPIMGHLLAKDSSSMISIMK